MNKQQWLIIISLSIVLPASAMNRLDQGNPRKRRHMHTIAQRDTSKPVTHDTARKNNNALITKSTAMHKTESAQDLLPTIERNFWPTMLLGLVYVGTSALFHAKEQWKN